MRLSQELSWQMQVVARSERRGCILYTRAGGRDPFSQGSIVAVRPGGVIACCCYGVVCLLVLQRGRRKTFFKFKDDLSTWFFSSTSRRRSPPGVVAEPVRCRALLISILYMWLTLVLQNRKRKRTSFTLSVTSSEFCRKILPFIV